MGILPFHRVQVLPQNGFPAHGVHQGYLHARQRDVGGHEVDPLRVVQDALAGGNGLVRQDLPHHVGECDGQLVRLVVAQADGKRCLGVRVHNQDLLSRLSQPYAQVGTGG